MDQMNNQSSASVQTKQKKPYARPKRMEWIRRTNRRLSLLRGSMVVLCGMLLVVGALLLILPNFKVREIVVEGELVTTTREEIIAASGVEIGTEIIGTDWKVMEQNIERQCPVEIQQITITASKVKIHVKEREIAYVKYGDYWFSLDENFIVTDISQNEADFLGLLRMELPQINGINEGEKLSFADGNMDLTYIQTMIAYMDENGLTPRVALLNVSDRFNVSYVLDGSIQVVLGKVRELDAKSELVNEILSLKNGADAYSVIDVSDVKRTTYRPVGATEFLMASA